MVLRECEWSDNEMKDDIGVRVFGVGWAFDGGFFLYFLVLFPLPSLSFLSGFWFSLLSPLLFLPLLLTVAPPVFFFPLTDPRPEPSSTVPS